MRGPCWTLTHASAGIGRTYPQHQDMAAGYDYDAPDSVHQLPYDALPDFEPNFNTVVIHGHAKLTDLISSAPIKNTATLSAPGFERCLSSLLCRCTGSTRSRRLIAASPLLGTSGSSCPSRGCL
jgi:hypothetical protein